MLEAIGEIMKIRFRGILSPAGVRMPERGSALLIVLGFLSFMIISGVSFSIYMRIERQASSNYRHAVTARHLLNSALYRAMDEIDSELRLAAEGQTKFPDRPNRMDWPGRVKVSAADNASDNNQNARVLSLEALSFLPAFLINDVRRFAVFDNDVDKNSPWMGAKWRPLERATDGDVIGRYAYVCVNVSDMLDVSLCRAFRPGSVCLGHLLDDDQARQDFDDDAKEDMRYFSLQDFYAARYARDKTPETSPYHAYIEPGSAKKGQLIVFKDSENLKHVYGTDSIALPETSNSLKTACNIYLEQPFAEGPGSLLMDQRPKNIADLRLGSPLFWQALKEMDPVLRDAPATQLPAFQTLMASMLADYLDTDDVPKQLGIPSAEMVPMISKIVIWKENLNSQVYTGPDSADKPPQKQYGVQLINNTMFTQIKNGTVPFVEVQVAYPFKYYEDRLRKKPGISGNKNYFLQARLGLKIVKAGVKTNTAELMTDDYNVEFESAKTQIKLDTLPPPNERKDDRYYYARQGVALKTVPGKEDNEVLVVKLDASDVPTPLIKGFAANDAIRVACTILVQVLDENDVAVDQVPCTIYSSPPLKGYDNDPATLKRWKEKTPKLYFATESITLNKALRDKTVDPLGPNLSYGITPTTPNGYTSLEIPDPRFNHAAMNWISRDVRWNIPRDEGSKNPSTDELLGRDGRDADIFMSVSDCGYMQSPGELGFILRAYPGYVMQYSFAMAADKLSGLPLIVLMDQAYPSVDFFTQKSVANMLPASDINAMFRTYRLYDHGGTGFNQKRDDIYGHFYVRKEDGTLPGTRVNPLSDNPQVLAAAIWDTPLDYWYADPKSTGTSAANRQKIATFNRSPLLFGNKNYGTSGPKPRSPGAEPKWERFLGGWTNALANCVTSKWTSAMGKPVSVWTNWNANLSDVYGDWQFSRWYSDATDTARQSIFGDPYGLLLNPLHEIDRKMLYAHSLDSFSERQQLFLYFLRAEIMLSAFGGSQGGAGGRAVALVWRDPYPRGYDKGTDTWDMPGNLIMPQQDQFKQGNNQWYPDNDIESPWEQYHKGKSNARWTSYHDTRVLFFKKISK